MSREHDTIQQQKYKTYIRQKEVRMFYSLVRLFNIAFSTLNSHKILPNLLLKSDINDM